MKNTSLLILLMLLSSSGSSKKQEVQQIGMELLSISFSEEKVPIGFLAALWSCNVTAFVGSYNVNRKTLITKEFNQTVEISGPTTLTFLGFISGFFSLKLMGENSEIKLNFTITFQESPGELKIDVSSNFSFNVTITCSMEDIEIKGTFICENNTCRQEGGEGSKDTKSGDSLRLYLLNSTIICSLSNQISKTQSQTTVQPNSTSEGPTEEDVSLPRSRVALYVSLGVSGLLLLGVGWCILNKKFNNRRERSRSETSLDVPPQPSQPILEGNEVSSQDEVIELNEMSGSDSGISLFTGNSLQGDDEEEL
ncbi:uncharacterized protein LOC103148600 isoform X2 [Poecilia formosa]|nr:PREDICTED: uncharacterized protein LOC103148600 isoform X2 [Poecilia formosa]